MLIWHESFFASTRSVQIATTRDGTMRVSKYLCLHTLRADCNFVVQQTIVALFYFASTRSVQIATPHVRAVIPHRALCLHTLRADCNVPIPFPWPAASAFASTRSVQIATKRYPQRNRGGSFASTRSVQIATSALPVCAEFLELCLHTLRADCNEVTASSVGGFSALPPHAPCRLQHSPHAVRCAPPRFASTRSVQIATAAASSACHSDKLCLHTLRADCNLCQIPPVFRAVGFASTRSVQIATHQGWGLWI